jgi:hypothetical protein
MKSIRIASGPLIHFPIIALCILSLVGCGSDSNDDASRAIACILLLPLCLAAGKSPTEPDDSVTAAIADNFLVEYDGSNFDGPTFHLSWDLPPANVNASQYQVKRNGATIAIVNDARYSDTGLDSDSEYCYSVVVIEENGSRFPANRPVCRTTSWNTSRIATPGNLISLGLDSSDHAYIWQVGNYGQKDDYTNWQLSTNQSGEWRQVPNPIDKDTGKQSSVIDHSYYFAKPFVNSGKINYINNSSGKWTNELLPYSAHIPDTAGTISLISHGGDNPQACISHPEAERLSYASKVDGKWVFQKLAVVTAHGCQLVLDATDSAHISYVDSNTGFLMHLTNASGIWNAQLVDDGDIYPLHSITVAYTDNVYIAYYDTLSGELRIASNATGVWSRQSLGGARASLYNPAIASDSAGRQHLVYEDESRLKYATNVSGAWQIYTIDAQDLINSFEIVLDSLDKVHIAYGWGAPQSQNVTYLANR